MHEVFVCTVCGHLWLIHRSHLTHPDATRCGYCNTATGCVAEALQPHDTQPGPLADKFERVMLRRLAGVPDRQAEWELRCALGVGFRPVWPYVPEV